MSLKRHEVLRPFSREHVIGLFHANQLMWLSNGRARCDLSTTIVNFRKAWDENIAIHFLEEERLLAPLPISPESADRLLTEHNMIRHLASELFSTEIPNPHTCYKIGKMLDDHIRWEEHYFFPEIEQSLSESQLEKLGSETNLMETTRKCSQ